MKMCQMDLPVPRPVAARVSRHGLYYCADIVTACLANTSALAERLGQGRLHAGVWQDIGACIRQFHDAGIFHADLNARNILLDQDDKVFLVDFDRGRQRHPDLAWQYANLNRLLRSLHKIQDREDVHYVAEADWSALMRGYWKNPESAAT